MIDIQTIRDNPEAVEENARNKGYEVDATLITKLDSERKQLLQQVETLRQKRNELSSSMKGGKPDTKTITEAKQVKEQLADLEERLAPVDEQLHALLKQVPNMALDIVPIGQSEDENVQTEEVGTIPEFSFTPKSHAELGSLHDWIDKERAAKVAGSRFAYVKGELAELQFAIVNWARDQLASTEYLKKLIQSENLNADPTPFVFTLPPAMIKTDIFDAMDRLEPRDDRYRVGSDEDDIWLQGSAEHTLGAMYAGEVIDVATPVRLVGYLTSFRREAGTYGKDTEGLIRMHQFNKLEMVSFSTRESGLNEHQLMVAIQKDLVKQLGLPYRVLNKCTADIGKPNASGWDIDVWFPSQNKYRETHTADYMTDYQARRLNTRYKDRNGTLQFVHNNDATVFAVDRFSAAVLENFQQQDGSVKVPEVLQKYINKEVLGEN
ncbi:TPA: serine--tRNA ligase [Candidatus Saccharibacteria bacterium]|nr:serine--tRNA ligase [Candidatus Saccharibacteria bacterium]HIO87234.1 serine--tRNA ligase [Candidatus Saccharibacteria bacterium]